MYIIINNPRKRLVSPLKNIYIFFGRLAFSTWNGWFIDWWWCSGLASRFTGPQEPLLLIGWPLPARPPPGWFPVNPSGRLPDCFPAAAVACWWFISGERWPPPPPAVVAKWFNGPAAAVAAIWWWWWAGMRRGEEEEAAAVVDERPPGWWCEPLVIISWDESDRGWLDMDRF